MGDDLLAMVVRIREKAERALASTRAAAEAYRERAQDARERGDGTAVETLERMAAEYGACARMGEEQVAALDEAAEARRRMDRIAFEAAMRRARALGAECAATTERLARETGAPPLS